RLEVVHIRPASSAPEGDTRQLWRHLFPYPERRCRPAEPARYAACHFMRGLGEFVLLRQDRGYAIAGGQEHLGEGVGHGPVSIAHACVRYQAAYDAAMWRGASN